MSNDIFTKTFYKYKYISFRNDKHSELNYITNIKENDNDYIIYFNLKKFNNNNICFIPNKVYRINNHIYTFTENIIELEHTKLDQFGMSIINLFKFDLNKYIIDTNFKLKLAGIYNSSNSIVYNHEILNLIFKLDSRTVQILYIINLIQNFNLNLIFPIVFNGYTFSLIDQLNQFIINNNIKLLHILNYTDTILSNYVTDNSIKYSIFDNPILNIGLGERNLYDNIFKFLNFTNGMATAQYSTKQYIESENLKIL